MKLLAGLVAVSAVAAGGLGATVAYTAASSTPPHTPAPPVAAVPVRPAPLPKVVPVIKLRFRPCAAGTRLEHGDCVRHLVHVVVVPAPAPVVPSAPAPAVGRTVAPSRTHRAAARPARHEAEHETEHESEHEAEHEAEPESGTDD